MRADSRVGIANQTGSHATARPVATVLWRWPIWLALTALLYGTMPSVHEWAFGRERLEEAAVRDVESRVGAQMSEAGRAMIVKQMATTPSWVSGASGVAATLISVVLAGVALTIGCVLIGSELPAGEIFGVASLAALAVAIVRVIAWGASVFATGKDGVVGLTWMDAGAVTAATWSDASHGSFLYYSLSAMDLTLLIGCAVAAVLLIDSDPKISPLEGAILASLWPIIVIVSRIGLSALLGFAV